MQLLRCVLAVMLLVLAGCQAGPEEGEPPIRHDSSVTKSDLEGVRNFSRIDEGTAFGVAVHESFGSFVAQIVEIERASQPVDRPKVRRVWCAASICPPSRRCGCRSGCAAVVCARFTPL